ncbi:DUF6879 family protein [Nocardiopsis trehalosi]|uniref:DUF6879 family protein n=1 Tax=Nocardiopsis trehalosi TaxID=109329 RepID=UPI0008318B49|nr:DUF6879 family protein [Nocardiopsis trehalosi]
MHVFEALINARGRELDRDAYRLDAAAVRADPEATGPCYRLQRTQDVPDPRDPARPTLLSGDLAAARKAFAAERPALREEAHRLNYQGIAYHRLRIMEYPLSDYVAWEALSLAEFAAAGHPIRVLDAERLASWEERGRLPDVVVYGRRVLYLLRTTADGHPAGAKRIDNPPLASMVTEAMAALYAQAQPFPDWFDREVAHRLPAL